jgi:hypothetical protein
MAVHLVAMSMPLAIERRICLRGSHRVTVASGQGVQLAPSQRCADLERAAGTGAAAES